MPLCPLKYNSHQMSLDRSVASAARPYSRLQLSLNQLTMALTQKMRHVRHNFTFPQSEQLGVMFTTHLMVAYL